ncbi:type II toxin-antitoxin system PemK/MazF family toxin [Rhodococcus opacus]|uniref:Growth inhibitor n=2 Tax=Rhodococcus TaxID=1827 RepID=K8XYQ6_RHOOP|nr:MULTISPECIES: type II toxin-antitoxin system PemK/MazF family toxin [Rhodococcus]EKT83447.1 growth inhibitor [Rhodococcus opacus M213]MDJ0420748.1 type II toxin-antitoxin system PemK/MazF family toxin [Rhodococcus opacus]MDV6245251.1 type II toxin-antitoxin system PemK/MazF family toxin [Rhodococcus opacus]QSE87367.1 type II toxin-antitoxin system PemK/MazF family toxin [Rhodococcus pseudokoreensis]WKN60031.1 type II toxin-antitoxin system PemK/MazF family toxin [Rhodococcus opacus]
MTTALRGQIYWFDMGHGEKPWVVVSNNLRNRNLHTVLAARITTTPKPGIPTAVPLGPNDPLVGSILADDIVQLFDDELEASRSGGALSPSTIVELNKALAIALALP